MNRAALRQELVDFGFDEVEYTVPERFEREFGLEAMRRWGFKRRPYTTASLSAAIKGGFTIARLTEQLGRSALLDSREKPC